MTHKPRSTLGGKFKERAEPPCTCPACSDPTRQRAELLMGLLDLNKYVICLYLYKTGLLTAAEVMHEVAVSKEVMDEAHKHMSNFAADVRRAIEEDQAAGVPDK